MYSSTLSLTSVLDEDVWSTVCHMCPTTGTDPVQLVQEAGWALGLFWMGV